MHFTVEAQNRVRDWIAPGDIAIDATAGNGFDTLFLANAVGPNGLVYAIDLQSAAIERVHAKLDEADLSARVELCVGDHAELERFVRGEHRTRVACAMFNLGYLPFSDKSIVTRAESSLPAIRTAASMLRPCGILTVLAYVGHEGGREEADAIADWVAGQSDQFDIQHRSDSTNPNSPILWWVQRRISSLDAVQSLVRP
ncbi:MAG: methyltransferase domain-containing protein [Planctomycetes bacterium]|nr:methyltransferase domain-containing protein [Planctomycetota bacterium]